VLGDAGPPLPRPLWATEQAGAVTAEAAVEPGLRSGTPVAAGTVDAAAEALSVRVRAPGDLMLMYGSTFFLILVADRVHPDQRMWGTQYVLPGTANIAAGTATAGSVPAWFRNLLDDGHGRPDFGRLDADAARRRRARPALSSCRISATSEHRSMTRLHAAWSRGLTLGHERGHFYRAILEGTAHGVRHILEAVAELNVPVKRIVAVGGVKGAIIGVAPQAAAR
jgi:xylulokinase